CASSPGRPSRRRRRRARARATATCPRRATALRPTPARARWWTSRRERRRSLRVLDAPRRPRDRAQPVLGDRLVVDLADAVGALVDALQRGVDLLQRLAHAFVEPFLELAVVRVGRHVADVVADATRAELVVAV